MMEPGPKGPGSIHNLNQDDVSELNVKCGRCSGMMIYEKSLRSSGFVFSWRCLMCGELIDQTIAENRDYQSHGGEWDKRGRKSAK
jgi:hypothetical protein